MGKKLKHGALRKDKYYARAKCAGYRARSAYKLIQLNEKYGFLQKSRVCIDLCAAPGSWMQVAQKFMPVSSCIIGVDRFRISPVYGCIAIEGDITTDKCRNDLKNNLKTWKADVVLHDGAPNMGKNWLYDAYQQNLLVLHAFKLACEFLKQGGYFVTKVFRSKDYFKLEYILKKLFKKVDATKPGASRYESAEIFVVCQGYLNPDKVDPHFFSPKYVFHDLDVEPNNKIDLIDRKKRRKAEGYEEGETIFFKKVKVSEFFETESHMELLRKAWELEFDDERIKNHPLTTADIIANCKDIKVLNRKDIKKLLIWRKKIKDEFDEQSENEKKKVETEVEKTEEPQGEEDVDDKLAELDKVEEQIKKLESEASHAEKKALKKKQKLLQKERERIRLKTLIPGDQGPVDQSEMGVFNLKRLRSMKDVNNVVDVPANIDPSAIDDDDDDENEPQTKRARAMPDEEYEENETAELEDDEYGEGNHLVTDLMDDTNTEKKIKKAELWFNRDIFQDVEDDADEDYGIDVAIEEYKALGGELYNPETDIVKMKKKRDQKLQNLKNKEKEEKLKKKEAREAAEAEAKAAKAGSIPGAVSKSASKTSRAEGKMATDIEKDQGIDMASEESDSEKESDGKLKGSDSDFEEDSDDEEAEIGPQLDAREDADEEDNKLDPVGLALATKMIHSAKSKRDVLDAAWNRYMTGEESLPEWFEDDENKYNKLPVEVEPSDLNMYRDREKNVNARTLKKVVEAKARKQRRMKKGLERARKKAESITSNTDMTQREKVQEVKKLYRSALKPLQKKERTYVVMKKMHQGKAPKGVKGPVRLVDKRMKKDARGKLKADSRKAKGGKRGKAFAGKGKGRGRR